MNVAASTYLNSAPLVYSFSSGLLAQNVTFLGDTAPSRCAELLERGEAAAALIPVIELERIPHLIAVPDVAVASKFRVRSVILASKVPIETARRVALDSSSRTSQALVRILFERRYKARPEFIQRAPNPVTACANMFEDCDAALVIGDPAMRLEADHDAHLKVYDLATEWRDLTGLPFVFAVWAVREGARIDPEVFLQAKEEGLARREQIAEEYQPVLRLPKHELLDYLVNNVNYDLDEENKAGMAKYFEFARELRQAKAL